MRLEISSISFKARIVLGNQSTPNKINVFAKTKQIEFNNHPIKNLLGKWKLKPKGSKLISRLKMSIQVKLPS